MSAACNANYTDEYNVKSGGKVICQGRELYSINQVAQNSLDSIPLGSPIPVFVHGYSGYYGNGQNMMIAAEASLANQYGNYVTPIMSEDRNSTGHSISEQADFLYEDLSKLLRANKDFYVSMYGGAKVPIDFIAFSQGFQVSLETIMRFVNAPEFDWVDCRVVGVSPVTNGIWMVNLLFGEWCVNNLFPINGPIGKALRYIKESLWESPLNWFGRKIGQAGGISLNEIECRERAIKFKRMLHDRGERLEDKVFLINSSCKQMNGTMARQLGVFQHPMRAIYSFLFGDKHDGLLTSSNQKENFEEVRKVDIRGDHMDLHVMNVADPNRFDYEVDGKSDYLYLVRDRGAFYINKFWGWSEHGNANKIAEEYMKWHNGGISEHHRGNEEHID